MDVSKARKRNRKETKDFIQDFPEDINVPEGILRIAYDTYVALEASSENDEDEGVEGSENVETGPFYPDLFYDSEDSENEVSFVFFLFVNLLSENC
jgi:hypothetical protein